MSRVIEPTTEVPNWRVRRMMAPGFVEISIDQRMRDKTNVETIELSYEAAKLLASQLIEAAK